MHANDVRGDGNSALTNRGDPKRALNISVKGIRGRFRETQKLPERRLNLWFACIR